MRSSQLHFALAFLLGASSLVTIDASAQQQPAGSVKTPAGEPARPRDTTKNLPSDTGSQTTTPAGAATGAGQPQGTTHQPDVGAPGGLERRARMQERAAGTTAANPASSAGKASSGARDTAVQDTPREGGELRSRPRRASKG